jgi:hypothetical protein
MAVFPTELRSVILVGLWLVTASLGPGPEAVAGQPSATTFWVTADQLMPAWGFYPLQASYGGTRPLGRHAAWCSAGNSGRLTWIAKFPRQAEYHVWVRNYGGYGTVAVSVDERPLVGGRGGSGGGRFVWRHSGRISVTAGMHHVDLDVDKGMFDAVAFTTDAKLVPTRDKLPEPLTKPRLRAPRAYRDDSHLAERAAASGFVVGPVIGFAGTLYDWLPDGKDKRPFDRLRMWGAANQYINGTFAIRAIRDIPELTVSLSRLEGPGGVVLETDDIDVRVVHVRERRNSLFRPSQVRMLTPEILLRDDRTTLPPKGRQGGFGGERCVTGVPAHESRQFWLTVHVPDGSPPGPYRGEVIFGGTARRRLEVVLDVLPITLKAAEGYYGIYHRNQTTNPKKVHHVSEARYLAELQDQVRHGLNAATLYSGFSTLGLARQAGMTRAPCLMHWPDGNAAQQVAAAKKMGFSDLFYYGVDEPTEPAAIERCRKEAQRRRATGLHMFTAINSKTAQLATRDFIDRPVYNIYVFGGPDNAEVMYARKKGFRPISYWVTATAFPLPYRALTGLYNTRCGYLGSSPWAYQDFPGNGLYDPDKPAHKVSYPDEFGQPIPTLAWEAHRAGIDDVRYLEALDRAIATAVGRLKQPDPPSQLAAALEAARGVRKARFESIGQRWLEYFCQLKPGDLDRSRRALADALVRLQAAQE